MAADLFNLSTEIRMEIMEVFHLILFGYCTGGLLLKYVPYWAQWLNNMPNLFACKP